MSFEWVSRLFGRPVNLIAYISFSVAMVIISERAIMMSTAATLTFLVLILAPSPSKAASCSTGGYALRTSGSSCLANVIQCPGGASTRCCSSELTCLVTNSAICCEGFQQCPTASLAMLILLADGEDCSTSLAQSPSVRKPPLLQQDLMVRNRCAVCYRPRHVRVCSLSILRLHSGPRKQ
jgi:hypothetical protein